MIKFIKLKLSPVVDSYEGVVGMPFEERYLSLYSIVDIFEVDKRMFVGTCSGQLFEVHSSDKIVMLEAIKNMNAE